MATPPTITHEGIPSTPAKEWAEKTTASLTPESSGINSTSHVGYTALTPGPQLPGAYPGDPGESSPFPTEDAKNAAFGVLQTAKQYIPTQRDVGKAMLSAGETAKQYLPNAVASYFPASSPNNEKPKDQEMLESGEVGGLPTEDDESGVANLPDKGNDPLPSAPRFPNGIARTPLTNPDSSRTSSIATNFSTQAQAGSDSATPVPSPSTPSNFIRPFPDTSPGDTEKTDLTSSSQHALVSDNVLRPSDTVPGGNAGQEGPDISKEDDQLAQQPILNTEPRAYPLAGQGAKSRGGPLSESAESLENESNASRSTNLKDETHPIRKDTTNHTPADIQPGIEPNIHSVQPATEFNTHSVQPATAINVPSGPQQTDTSHLVHKRDGSATSNTSGSSRMGSGPPSGSPHRSRFLDKVKGEVKVISGKLAHNEEKVEEGRRLMGKTV